MPDFEVTAAVLGRVIVQAGRALDLPFARVLDRYDLTRNAWWLLSELYRSRHQEVASVGVHARRSALAPSSATIAAEALVVRGLVQRWRPDDNRRVTYITITDTGTALVETVRIDLEEAVADLYDRYDSGDRDQLHALLVRLVDTPDAGASPA